MDKIIKIFIIVVLVLFIPLVIWEGIKEGNSSLYLVLTIILVFIILLAYTIKKIFPYSKIGRFITKFLDFIREFVGLGFFN